MLSADFEFLKTRVGVLLEIAKKFNSICPETYYETGAWSAIKLLTILRFVPIYTKIIPKYPQYFRKMYYIELLAGAGLCKIRPRGDVVAGSALMAATLCYEPFDEYILVEKEEERANALEQRMRIVTKNLTIYKCDCNECIGDIVNRMETKSHYLAFVDCEGVEVEWRTLQTLLGKPGDMLFNFQSQSVARLVGRAKKGKSALEETLNRFFGDDGWKKHDSPDSLLHYYIEKIRYMTSRDIVLSFPVKGPRGFRYDILLATRRTRGGSPWIMPMIELQEKVEKYRFRTVELILDILKGRVVPLDALL